MLVRILITALVWFAVSGTVVAADAVAGKAYFREVCTACHTAEPTDGGGEMGPTLFSLYGRSAATGDEAFPYTQALKDSKIVWSAQTLERFLADPMKAVPGTKMPMPVAEQKDRDNLAAYFQSLVTSAK